jgi:hypothetical protein
MHQHGFGHHEPASVTPLYYTAPPPQVVGVRGGQSGASASFVVLGTTANAGAVTVDTGYSPASGHAAKLDGGFNAVDRTAQTTHSGGISGAVRNFGGLVVAGSIIAGGNGDASLATATMSFSVVAGTLHVTFTPPALYVGTLDWLLTLNTTEN